MVKGEFRFAGFVVCLNWVCLAEMATKRYLRYSYCIPLRFAGSNPARCTSPCSSVGRARGSEAPCGVVDEKCCVCAGSSPVRCRPRSRTLNNGTQVGIPDTILLFYWLLHKVGNWLSPQLLELETGRRWGWNGVAPQIRVNSIGYRWFTERFFGWQGLINLVSGMGKSHHSKNSCWYSHKPDPAGFPQVRARGDHSTTRRHMLSG